MLTELQVKFERINPLFLCVNFIAPLDLMKTSSRINVNIPTENHFTESFTCGKTFIATVCKSNYGISKATIIPL